MIKKEEEFKAVTFDVLITELHQAMKQSNEVFLEAMSDINDPITLIQLLTEYNEYVAMSNSEIIGALTETFLSEMNEYNERGLH